MNRQTEFILLIIGASFSIITFLQQHYMHWFLDLVQLFYRVHQRLMVVLKK